MTTRSRMFKPMWAGVLPTVAVLAAAHNVDHSHNDHEHSRILGVADEASAGAAHSCIHDYLASAISSMHGDYPRARQLYTADPFAPVPDADAEGGSRVRSLQQAYSPMRITLDTTRLSVNAEPQFACYSVGQQYQPTLASSSTQRASCQASDILSEEKRAYLVSTVLPAAVQFFQDTLSVIPVSGNLVLNNPIPDASCCNDNWGVCNSFVCCESYFPTADETTGVANTDFRLYVTARPTGGSTIAWALTCQSDQYGRPIAGHINFNPSRVSTLAEDFPGQLSTSVHELMHALGFSSSNFYMWRRPGTTDQAWPTEVIATVSELGRTVKKIITSNVVAAVKSHFDCLTWTSSVAGMELEDFGGSGTAGSHWEKRLLMNEVMTGTADPNSVYSSITLAAFADMGWYQVSYTRAQRLPWGNAEGCSFVQNQCSSWSSRYFCTVASQGGCTPDMRYRASCNLFDAPFTLPSANQYFPGYPNRGGSNPYMDYCPVFSRLSNGDCTSSNTVGLWFYGETVGSSSRCFAGTYQRSSISATPAQHGGCLEASCTPSNLIQVRLIQSGGGKLTVICPRNGGDVDLLQLAGSEFKGTLTCPPADTMCTGDPCDSNTCSNRGTCNSADGTCACNSGFYGETIYDCANKYCPLGRNATSGNMTECAGNARCDKTTGSCLDESGQPGCYAGWTDGPDGKCSRVGCPSRASSACNTTSGICECAGRGTCQSNGVCVCSAGYIGNDCGLTDCPGSPRCSGSASGSCDGLRGYCECSDAFDSNAQPLYYSGSACSESNSGARPIIALGFTGEVDPSTNTTRTAYTGVLRSKEYTHFSFQVPSTQFPISLRLQLTGGALFSSSAAAAANWSANQTDPWVPPATRAAWYQDTGMSTVLAAPAPVLVASYASSGRPTARSSTFTVTSVDAATAAYAILFSSAGAENAFNQIGTMVVGILSPVDAFFTLSLTRDGCAVLNCSHGTCSNGACVCPRASEAATPSRTYGWSGVMCEVADCPGAPDCGGDTRGRCITPNDRQSLPYCQCFSSYSGERCQSLNRDRAVTREFGLDDTDAYDRSGLTTVTYFSTDSSGNTTVSERVLVYNATWSGALDVGRNVTPVVIDPTTLAGCCGMNETLSVYARLDTSESQLADGMLLGLDGDYPSLAVYSQFDLRAWRGHAPVHEIVTTLSTRAFFITIFNGRYAEQALSYNLYVEVASGSCPPSLNKCNGHGFCQSGLCRCLEGWEGTACTVPAPRVAATGTAVVLPSSIAPGSWQYFVHEVNGSVAELSVSLTRTGSSRSKPLLLAASVSAPGPLSLAKLTSELALFDFDGYTRGAQTQTIRFRREDTTSFKYLYIGVHNTLDARAALAADITVTSSPRYAVPLCTGGQVYDDGGTPTPLPSNETCSSRFCSGRGTYELSNTPSGQVGSCRCESGWNPLSYCTAPSFGSFEFFAAAAQEVDFLCSVCEFNNLTLSTGGIALYSIPQPLQKSTGLKIDVRPATGAVASTSRRLAANVPAAWADPAISWMTGRSRASTPHAARYLVGGPRALDVSTGPSNSTSTVAVGNPSLLVSTSLPRSIIDFIYIASTASVNETVRIDNPSPSGKYWIAVYANTPGVFTVAAARQTFGVTAAAPPSFASQLGSWFMQTTGGIVVLAGGGLLLFCVCASCWLQQCAPSCVKKRQEHLAQQDEVEHAKRELFRSVRTLQATGASKASAVAAVASSSRRLASANASMRRLQSGQSVRSMSAGHASPSSSATARKVAVSPSERGVVGPARDDKLAGPAMVTPVRRTPHQAASGDSGVIPSITNPLLAAKPSSRLLLSSTGAAPSSRVLVARSPAGSQQAPSASPKSGTSTPNGGPQLVLPPSGASPMGLMQAGMYPPMHAAMLSPGAHMPAMMPVMPFPGGMPMLHPAHARHLTPGFFPTMMSPHGANGPAGMGNVVLMDSIPAPPPRVAPTDLRSADV